MTVEESAQLFVTLGGVLMLGLAADAIGRRTRLPRVTLLLALGFLVGPSVLDLLPESRETMFKLSANVALTMVGFLLGNKLGHVERGPERREIFVLSLTVVTVTAVIVIAGLILAQVSLPIALILGGIATATAPAATMDVVREWAKSSRFSSLLLAVVAVDDAWGLIAFSLLLATAQAIAGQAADSASLLLSAGWEIGGALLLGIVLGAVMAGLTGRVAKGEPTVLEAVGLVLLVCGLSLLLHVSFILSAMVMGTMVARLAKHHEHPFHVIENLELPFMIVFFVLAGASLDPAALGSVGWVGVAYIVLRIAGRIGGGWLGATLSHSNSGTRSWIGLAMMPQAGVALGMALLAAEHLPDLAGVILQVTIGATVFFEITGPIVTRWALERTAPDDPVKASDVA
jgi:Kef-type K+ transport system membrane component KefB